MMLSSSMSASTGLVIQFRGSPSIDTQCQVAVSPRCAGAGSVAMSLLGDDDAPGVMFFSSRDPQHYQQGQGTQLLQEIARMLPGLLERWIERA